MSFMCLTVKLIPTVGMNINQVFSCSVFACISHRKWISSCFIFNNLDNIAHPTSTVALEAASIGANPEAWEKIKRLIEGIWEKEESDEKKESEKILNICNHSLCQIINAGAEEVQLCFVWSADVIEQHSLAVKALFHNAQLSFVCPPNPTLHRLLSLTVATALQTARVYWNLGGQTHKTNFVYRFPGLYFCLWAFNYKCCREGICTCAGEFLTSAAQFEAALWICYLSYT